MPYPALDWTLGSSKLPEPLRRTLSVWFGLVSRGTELSVTLPVLFFQLGFTFGNLVGMYLAQNYNVSDHIHILHDSM